VYNRKKISKIERKYVSEKGNMYPRKGIKFNNLKKKDTSRSDVCGGITVVMIRKKGHVMKGKTQQQVTKQYQT
jgi:hypothetical protein